MLDLENLPPRLTRAEASAYLHKRHGISRSHSTLAKLACLGGGPSFRRAGHRSVLYDVAELDRWASALLSQPARSTSAFFANEIR